VACGFWFNRGFQSSCNITVNPDGTVNLVEGSVDIGGSRASIAQQAAETLGIPYQDVKPTVVDTDSIGYTMVTGGSRVTFATGWAAIEAAEDVKQQMTARAAKIWDASVEDVEYQDGIIHHKSDPELRVTFKELARQLLSTGGSITGRSNVDPAGEGNAFGVHIADLEVDPETGKTDVLRYTAIQDAGKAVHPSYVEGQMQGGAVQGIGWALNEEYFFNGQGQMMNSSFLDYRMPTSLDLPMIDTVIVEVANPGHPYGVRGVGEVPIVPPLAAIANAVYRATGHRMRKLPITPGSILEARWENGS
jgi:CO/xanthine dehydrogenase Mo-binding subunit